MVCHKGRRAGTVKSRARVMGREKEKCTVILRGGARCSVDSDGLPMNLASFGGVERVEKEDRIRGRGLRRIGGVHRLMLRGTRKLGYDDNGHI